MAGHPLSVAPVDGGFFYRVYCVYLLNQNKTWGRIARGIRTTYGASAGLTGLYGRRRVAYAWCCSIGNSAAYGWPVFMTVDIIAAESSGERDVNGNGKQKTSTGLC